MSDTQNGSLQNRQVILVTGVSGYWGSLIAKRLLAENLAIPRKDTQQNEDLPGQPLLSVMGLDVKPPEEELEGLDFVQADVRNPLLMELLETERVHTVVHLAFNETRRPSESAFDSNVIGTMKVLGACAEAGVRKVVMMSSTAVYGAHRTNSAFLTEGYPLQGSRSVGWVRDLVEIENFCNGFRRQFPGMLVTILRFPFIVGPTVDSPLTRLLRQPWPRILMGFDPLMQVIHEQDVIDALLFAVHNDVPGVFNVADEGILPLLKLLALAGKVPLPVIHLFQYWKSNLLGPANATWPIDLDYLRYQWVADLRSMREVLGFVPRYTAEETIREYAGTLRLIRFQPEEAPLKYDEDRLRDTLERRRRMRERQVSEQKQEIADER
jgi:UDP-glucose 4-epimerase